MSLHASARTAIDDLAHLRDVLAPLGRAVGAVRLTGGFFAHAFLVAFDDGAEVVVKTSPADANRLLTYEDDLLRSEAFVYQLLADVAGVPVPQVLLEDYTRTRCPWEVLAVTRVPGVPLVDGAFALDGDDPRGARVQHELGAVMARIHAVRGTTFGYVGERSPLRAPTWPEAFGRMVEAALADAARWDVPIPDDEIRAALAVHHGALAAVTTPALVHTDLWAGNVFVDLGTGALVGVIDPERSLWGDPLLDLVGTNQTGREPVPPALLAGHATPHQDCSTSSQRLPAQGWSCTGCTSLWWPASRSSLAGTPGTGCPATSSSWLGICALRWTRSPERAAAGRPTPSTPNDADARRLTR